MTSDTSAFVWVWLPRETTPVPAGKLTVEGPQILFNYGQSYLKRSNAIAIGDQELPLGAGFIPLAAGLTMPGCIRDGSPDAWGRRVIINRIARHAGPDAQLDELTYLLESGSDRIGALDFQRSATHYEARSAASVTLEELIASADRVEHGVPLMPELDLALHHGSAIGGARPKALIDDSQKKYIAKFSSSSDVYNVIKAEFIAMRLAERAGLRVAPVKLVRASYKDVLLVERFDRELCEDGWQRRGLVSALTLLGLDEMMARYASYEALAEIIRHRFTHAAPTLEELYGRLCFNILCGNNDDHARNHAAFWGGDLLSLTPAYDICPQARSGNISTQAMRIMGNDNRSQLAVCIDASAQFLLSRARASEIAEQITSAIVHGWQDVCATAQVNTTDRLLLANRQFLNSYAFEGLPDHSPLVSLAAQFKNSI